MSTSAWADYNLCSSPRIPNPPSPQILEMTSVPGPDPGVAEGWACRGPIRPAAAGLPMGATRHARARERKPRILREAAPSSVPAAAAWSRGKRGGGAGSGPRLGALAHYHP